MFLKIDNNTIEFSDDLLKISTYFEYYAKEYNEAIPVLIYDTEIFEIFIKWFKLLQDEGIVKIENNIITPIFKPEFFENYSVETKNKLFGFAVINQIDLLVYTLAYVLRNSDNQMINDINKNEKFIVDYSSDINKITSINIYQPYCSKSKISLAESELQKVIVPYGVNIILDNSFACYKGFTSVGVKGVKEVHIPFGVEEIRDEAFFDCFYLENINPECVKDFKCVVSLPQSVKKIGDKAFASCEKFEYVILPDSITKIGKYAFSRCYNLEHIKLPKYITKINEGMFSNCSNLKHIDFPDSTESAQSVLTESGMQSILTESGMQSVLTKIGKGVFSYCHWLEHLTIPKSVNSIGNRIFEGCRHLKTVILPNSLTKIGKFTFAYCENLESIRTYGAREDVQVSLPNIKKIGSYAFEECKKLKYIEIPNSVTKIKSFAFYGCQFEKFIIPESVKEIGYLVFKDCTNLKEIEFHQSLKINPNLFERSPFEKLKYSLGNLNPKCIENGFYKFNTYDPNSVNYIEPTEFNLLDDY